MQIGETKTAIEVSAPVVMLDTQSATQSASLTSTMVTELPMDVREPWGLGADKQGISVSSVPLGAPLRLIPARHRGWTAC